ncbi:MAG: iron-containing alcohol dehydrogenase, partial [Oscillospiraceae bacterium]
VAHGAGLAAVWGTWARYVIGEKPTRFCDFANHVFGLQGENAGLEGIEAMEAVFRFLEMPTNLTALLGFTPTDVQIEEMTEKCAHHNRTIGSFKVLGKEDIRRIYLLARNG